MPTKHRTPFYLILVGGLGVAACSSNSSGPEESGYAACGDVAFETLSAQSLDEVPVGRLPSSFQEPYAARIIGDGGETEGYAPVVVDESGDAYLVVPVHPVTPLDGGPVQLALTDSTQECAPIHFDVEPLPAADGEVGAVADLLETLVDQQAVLLGTTTDAILATDPDQLPQVYYPLAVLVNALENPDNPYSLASVLDGSSPWSDDGGIALAERLLAKAGVRDALEAAPAAVESVGGPSRVEDPNVECVPEYIGADAGRLDACMELAFELTAAATGATGQILNDLSNLFAVAGLIPNPGVEITAAIAGLAVFIVQTHRARLAAFLPSSLVGLDVDFGQTEYLEDEVGPGGITKADMTATNDEWDMGKEVIEGVLQVAGFGRTLEKFGGVKALNDIGVFIVSSGLIPALLGEETLDTFVIDPVTFGPVHVISEEWSDISVVQGTAITFTSHTIYDLEEAGSATILIHTKDGAFGRQRLEKTQVVTIGQLDLDIDPEEIIVEPGELVFFKVTVTDAAYPEAVDFVDGLTLQGDASIAYDGEGTNTHTVSYTAPLAPNSDEPDVISVRHTSTFGARGGDAPPRTATAVVRFGGVTITTAPTCVPLGSEPIQIDADVAGGIANPDLVWSASAGEISETGLFTPPAEAQVVTITVSLANKPGIKDSIDLPVGLCSCSATMTLDGSLLETRSLLFYLSSDLTGVQSFAWDGNVGSATFGFGTDFYNSDVVPIGATGSFDGLVLGSAEGNTFRNPDDPDAPSIPPLSVSLIENTGSEFGGTVEGNVSLETSSGTSVVPLSFQFHIDADPAYSQDDVKVCYVSP